MGPGSSGYEQLSKDFQTCEPLQTSGDVATLFGNLMGNIQVCFGGECRFVCMCACVPPTHVHLSLARSRKHTTFRQGTVQYNRESSRAPNVTDICKTLTNPAKSSYQNFIDLSATFMEEFFSNDNYNGARSYDAPCEDASWNASLAQLSNASRDESNNMRPWTYQTCNEFGYFQTATSPTSPWLGLQVS